MMGLPHRIRILVRREFSNCFCFLFLLSMSCTAMAQFAAQSNEPNINELITRCAPTVHPETMTALMSAESSGHQYAIADAGPVKLPWSKRKHMVKSFYMDSLGEAVTKANELKAQGHTVSLGLMQVNDRNLPSLGISIEQVFDLCTNINAGAKILTDFYLRAVPLFGQGDKAMRAALSAYNSGDWVRGERDGYVDLVYQKAGKPFELKTAGSMVPKIEKLRTRTPKYTKQSNPVRREFTLGVKEFIVR